MSIILPGKVMMNDDCEYRNVNNTDLAFSWQLMAQGSMLLHRHSNIRLNAELILICKSFRAKHHFLAGLVKILYFWSGNIY